MFGRIKRARERHERLEARERRLQAQEARRNPLYQVPEPSASGCLLMFGLIGLVVGFGVFGFVKIVC